VPWWSWLVIWTGLVLALLGMLAWSGISLFRKLMTMTDAAGAIVDQLADVDPDPHRADDGGAETSAAAFRPAIFASRRELASIVDRHRVERELRRQVRRDDWVTRGKLLQHGPVVPLAPPEEED
jgi:hypothetical protein